MAGENRACRDHVRDTAVITRTRGSPGERGGTRGPIPGGGGGSVSPAENLGGIVIDSPDASPPLAPSPDPSAIAVLFIGPAAAARP